MIALLDAAHIARFERLCDQDRLYGADIRTRLAVFGPGARQADFWLATTPGGSPCAALCREHGRMMIASDGRTDLAELRGFLRMVGGWGALYARAQLCGALFPDALHSTGFAMEYPGGYRDTDFLAVTEELRLDDLYSLLDDCFEDFGGGREQWYVYASHLFRHGLGFAAGIYENGTLAATAGVYAIAAGYGVVASVATARRYRGRGLATLLIRYVCGRLLGMEKTPVLLCADDRLAPYYEGLGFRAFDRWGCVLR